MGLGISYDNNYLKHLDTDNTEILSIKAVECRLLLVKFVLLVTGHITVPYTSAPNLV
jgi:hypothetical protein